MIFGVGTDIVRIQRMAKNLDRWGDRFAERILTPEEMEDYLRYSKKAGFLAKRFAAKEAAAKAMGLGFQDGLEMKQIGTGHDDKGKPLLMLTGYARTFVESNGITATHISVTDEQEYAIAFVVLECN